MAKRGLHGLTQKQFDLLDFCFEFISKQGFSPSLAHIVEATGYNPGGVGTTLQGLAFQKRVGIRRDGSGMSVVSVTHPAKGHIALEAVFYDPELDASYFEKEFNELPTRINRYCLTCKSHFETRSKYVRLCNACRVEVTALNGEAAHVPGGYVSNILAVSTERGVGHFKRGTK